MKIKYTVPHFLLIIVLVFSYSPIAFSAKEIPTQTPATEREFTPYDNPILADFDTISAPETVKYEDWMLEIAGLLPPSTPYSHIQIQTIAHQPPPPTNYYQQKNNGNDPVVLPPNSDHHNDGYWAELAKEYPAFELPKDINQNLVPSDDGEWTPLLPWAHIPVSAANLPDGRIITWASNKVDAFPGGQPEFTYAGIYDPITTIYTPLNNPNHDMFCAHTVMLDDGRVFVNGGRNTVKLTTTFDYTTDSYTAVQQMNDPRWYPTSVTLPGNRVFVASGSGGPNSTELWTENGGWDTLANINWSSIANASGFESNWWPYLWVAPNGKLFHAGPTQDMHWVDTAGEGTLTNLGARPIATSNWYPKHAGVVMYDEGKVLIAGGAANTSGGSSSNALTIDINTETPQINNINNMAYARRFPNAVMLPNGETMVMGGNTSGIKFNDSGTILIPEIWNPNTGLWRAAAAMSAPRNYHSVGLLLPDGRVFSGGGGLCGNCAANHQNAQIYTPPFLFNPDGSLAPRPSINSAPDVFEHGQTVTVNATIGMSRFTMIKMSATTHGLTTDTRFLEIPFTDIGGGNYELTLHENPNVMTPGYYMLFALNTNGVPSVSKIIRVASIPNIAEGKPTSQSSTDFDGVPSRAVDGNTNGVYNNGSTTHTTNEPNAWWQVDLGDLYDLRDVRLWNRTDCCANRLSNYYIFASETDLTGRTFNDILNDPLVWQHYEAGEAPVNIEIPIIATARYFRVQLAVTNPLSLAEVQLYGQPFVPPPPITIDPIVSPPQPTNNAILYSANSSGGENVMYQWDFGDGTPPSPLSSIPTASHSFAQAGRYLVTLTASGTGGDVTSIQFWQAVHNPLTANTPNHSMSVVYETRAGNDYLWTVNPDNNSVTAFDVVTNSKIAEISVGTKPRSIAIAPDGRLWVVNKGNATISIINPNSLAAEQNVVLPYASQPYGVVMANGSAYVTLQATGQLVELNATTGATIDTLDVGANPRHLSVTGDGNTFYISRFITPPLPDENTAIPQTEVGGNKLGGEVIVVDTATMSVSDTIVLQNNDAADASNSARGVPNYLGVPALSPDGLSAWIPSKQDNILRGGFRDGNILNHENTVRAITSRLDLVGGNEDYLARVDHDNGGVPSASLFGVYGNYLFTALEASREVVVLDAYGEMELFRFDVGRAPQGLAIAPDGLTLYVHNFMERTVSVHDISDVVNAGGQTVTTIATYNLVATELLSADVLLGKQLFYDAADTRLAADGYISCAACHNDGDSDGRVWDLTNMGEGLRTTIDLNGRAGLGHGVLHWTGNFDEVQDFEGQIRALAAGTGLMDDVDFNAGTTSQPLGNPKTGISPDLDALSAYVSSLVSFPDSPYRNTDGTLTASGQAGQAVFASETCAACHGGYSFTDSALDTLNDIGTIGAGSGSRLGTTLTGFDTPTLRGVWSAAPYLHDGSAATLGDAVSAHNGVSLSAGELADLVSYLEQIDGNEPAPSTGTQTGTILRQWWLNIISGDVADLVSDADYPDNPDGSGLLTSFEAPEDFGDIFGQRIVGYVHPPTTGDYEFWLASDDSGELWLSTDEDPNHAVLIGSVPGWTYPREWDKYGTQASGAINLQAGQKYYIYAIGKDFFGGDSLAVAWQPPGGVREVIAGQYLSPLDTGTPPPANQAPTVTPIGNQTHDEGTLVAVQIVASDPEGSVLSYSGTGLPDGLSVNSNSGLIGGFLGYENAGIFNPTISVSDGISETTETFTWVINDATPPAGGDTGTISREWWLGIFGTAVSDFTTHPNYPDSPDGSEGLTSFDAPQSFADTYGQRIIGFVHPPVTGDYQFWIASDDGGELWLSTDETPGNAILIGSVPDWTSYQEWEKYPSQDSGLISLVGGEKYYIVGFSKDNFGGDHLSVAWTIPGGTRAVIDGQFLSPLAGSSNNVPPVLTNPGTQSSVEGDVVSLPLVAVDANSDPITYTVSGLPAGLGYNMVTGVINGSLGVGSAGIYNVVASVTDGQSSDSEIFTWVVNDTPPPPPPPITDTGQISYEWWNDTIGFDMTILTNDPRFPDNPSGSMLLFNFETPHDQYEFFGSRIQGYIHPPVTGLYRFWVSADDEAEVRLSTDADPANKTLIANVPSWTFPHQWDKYASQKSALILLEAGQAYYVEVLAREGGAGDHVAVAWQPPGGVQSVIDGQYLSAYEENAGSGFATSSCNPATAATLTVAESGTDTTLLWHGFIENWAYRVLRLTSAYGIVDAELTVYQDDIMDHNVLPLDSNYFYEVVSENYCGDAAPASNRVGSFSFDIVAGE